METMPKQDSHILYRFFNEAGELLYVGITKDPLNRFRGHQSDKRWFPQVAKCTMEHFATRDDLVRCMYCEAKWTESEWVEEVIAVYRRRIDA